MQVIEETIISDAEAKRIISDRSKEKDLKFEQQNALDTLEKFVSVSADDAKKMGEELFKISKLKDRHIAAIVSFLPQDKDDIRAILHKDATSLTEDESNLVLETVKKFI